MKKTITITLISMLFITCHLFGCIENKGSQDDTSQQDTKTDYIIQKPGFDEYNLTFAFNDPLNLSDDNPGPGGKTTLESCINHCSENLTCECRDWIQSIYLSFDTTSPKDVGKLNGIWLPTICTIRAAVKKIPTLKEIGINTVSLGPDIDTRHLDKPEIIGENLFRFYIKLFEDTGFNVHLVPNPMHWGNNDVSLYDLNQIILDWAEEAEKLNTKFYVVFNEVDGMQEDISETSIWLQQVLPQIKEKYSGLVCVQPTQPGFQSTIINYSGYDCVSSFYPLMVPDEERNNRHINEFKTITEQIKSDYSSIKYILFNDVATFSGGNWAETGLMEAQFEAEKRGQSDYCTEEQQAEHIEQYLNEMHPYINGSFFNNYKGFTFIGRAAEQKIKEKYTEYGTLETLEKDYIWNTTGLLDLIENATLDGLEKMLIFDLETYSGGATGLAGLCFEPTAENPGPFNCSSVEGCMQLFKENPEEYWAWRINNC